MARGPISGSPVEGTPPVMETSCLENESDQARALSSEPFSSCPALPAGGILDDCSSGPFLTLALSVRDIKRTAPHHESLAPREASPSDWSDIPRLRTRTHHLSTLRATSSKHLPDRCRRFCAAKPVLWSMMGRDAARVRVELSERKIELSRARGTGEEAHRYPETRHGTHKGACLMRRSVFGRTRLVDGAS